MNVTETIVVNDAATLERSDTVSRNAILAVSFGTVHTETRDKTIGAIEQAMREGFPGWEVRRALTSPTILRKLAAAGEPTANLWQALGQLREESVSRVVCQSTYVVNGEEQEAMVREAEKCAHWFDQLVCGTPLLTSQEDLEAVARAIEAEFSGLSSEEALVLVGHGTKHSANTAYAALEYVFHDHGACNIFVGTVESYPGLSSVLRQVDRLKPQKVTIAPLMVVAGEHARNDMAGERHSWKAAFEERGYPVQAILKGLGEYPGIRAVYAAHARQAAEQLQ